MNKSFQIKAAIVVVLLSIATMAEAVEFDDVNTSTRFNVEINALAELSIARGNGEGMFFPNDFLNRAELLLFAYRTANKVPLATDESCFTDVSVGEWYTNYVCDAKAKGYVQGYPDGTFKPAQLVSRIEGLKMIVEVLELEIAPASMPDFTDVDTNAWYYPYITTTFANDLMPSTLYTFMFGPAEPLVRNEMAAIVYNAYMATDQDLMQSSSSQSSTTADLINTETSRPKTNANFNPDPLPQIGQFPWSSQGVFTNKKPVAHVFSLTQDRTVKFTVNQSIAQGTQQPANCTLYISEPSGFNYKYFLGVRSGKDCTIVATLQAGEYQWQINPSISNANYTTSVSEVSGDTNDGYHQAKLVSSTVQTHSLGVGNTHNWYTFTVDAESDQTVTVSNSSQVTCTIIAMEDVDLFGFSGPKCNELYTYPTGTYYISVQRLKAPVEQSVQYSIYKN